MSPSRSLASVWVDAGRAARPWEALMVVRCQARGLCGTGFDPLCCKHGLRPAPVSPWPPALWCWLSVETWVGHRCCQTAGGLGKQGGREVVTGRAASRSPYHTRHTRFIQRAACFGEQALCVLRRQELWPSQPAAAFAHSAWVLQSGSSQQMPTLLCSEGRAWLLGTQEHLQEGPGCPTAPKSQDRGQRMGGAGRDSSGGA